MKKYWHTKTLFIQWWKYKWSYKYEYCIWCKWVEAKHKWNWYCTKCHDKRRRASKQRRWQLKIQWVKFHFKQRALQYLEKKERKRKYITIHTPESKKEYQRQWYIKNKAKNSELYKLKSKIQRMKKAWKPMLQMIIWWKTVYFPFEWIEKPNIVCIGKTEEYTSDFKKYLQDKRWFEVLKEYYLKTIKDV